MNGTLHPLWRTARWTGVVLTAALLAALVATPEPALRVLWNGLIPLVPASLLVTPLLWRNVCPLATLNLLTGDRPGRLVPGRALLAGAAVTGMVLLAVLVPARRFLFNTDGPVLAATITAVALLALALGTRYDMKAGFCNALCPVLPVERLYGQAPLAHVPNARCAVCTLCTRQGCVDLAPTKAISQVVGPARRTAGWLATPFGLFAAAFPGFVAGYYTLTDGPLATAGTVYLHVAVWSAGSFAIVAALVLLTRPSSRAVFPLLGAAAAGLYYWFAGPAIATAWQAPVALGWGIRAAALLLLLAWLARALRHPPATVPATA